MPALTHDPVELGPSVRCLLPRQAAFLAATGRWRVSEGRAGIPRRSFFAAKTTTLPPTGWFFVEESIAARFAKADPVRTRIVPRRRRKVLAGSIDRRSLRQDRSWPNEDRSSSAKECPCRVNRSSFVPARPLPSEEAHSFAGEGSLLAAGRGEVVALGILGRPAGRRRRLRCRRRERSRWLSCATRELSEHMAGQMRYPDVRKDQEADVIEQPRHVLAAGR
jgi:hypothetical protein